MPDRLGAEAAGPVLILAPTGRDAASAAALLGREAVACRVCPDLDALCTVLGDDAGAVLVADEALARTDLSDLARRVAAQPPWSDLPFVVLTRSGPAPRRALVEMSLPEVLGNVMVLERPLNALGLVSAVRSALRARRRQRQVSAYLAERERAATVLAASEARFQAIADCIDQMVWSTRPDGYHDYYNQRWYDFTGASEGATDGEAWRKIYHPDDRERSWAAWDRSLATGVPYRSEYRLRHRSGQYRWVLGRAQPVRDGQGRIARWYGTCTDIDEIVRAREVLVRSREALEREIAARTAELMAAEASLRQAQKMEAVGQLTGGIAHDFNNMLQAIAGSLDLMRRRMEQGRIAEAGHFADAARQTVERAAALTQRLLAFARRQALQPEVVEPNALITGVAELVRRTVGPGIAVELREGSSTWSVRCDPSQLENALLNLAINARDAMPEGGRLTISTADVALAAVDVAGQDGAAPGDYVEVAVSDSGTGMDEATQARAFEPFFTTKPLGQGTGLGLSQIYGFVRQSGGIVRLDSAPGRGTAVRLYLPRHQPAQRSRPALGTTAVKPKATAAGERVLLVEDEAVVRAVAAEHLRELGYAVLEAEDGPAALRLLYSGAGVDVLVTDVGLPNGLNGRQVADMARERLPGLPVLFVTGYTGGVLDVQLAPGMAVIGKPFALDTLATRVRIMLGAPRHDPDPGAES